MIMLLFDIFVTYILPQNDLFSLYFSNPDSKVHGANMGPSGADRTPKWAHVGPMNFAIWEIMLSENNNTWS